MMICIERLSIKWMNTALLKFTHSFEAKWKTGTWQHTTHVLIIKYQIHIYKYLYIMWTVQISYSKANSSKRNIVYANIICMFIYIYIHYYYVIILNYSKIITFLLDTHCTLKPFVCYEHYQLFAVCITSII